MFSVDFVLTVFSTITDVGLGLALAMVRNTYQLSTLSRQLSQLHNRRAAQVPIRASSVINLDEVRSLRKDTITRASCNNQVRASVLCLDTYFSNEG